MKRLVTFALLAVAVSGCGSSSTKAPSTPAKLPAPSAAAPSLPRPTVKMHIAAGANGLKVGVKLGHFKIAPTMVGKAPVPGMGHLHFMLDGGKFDTPRYAGANGRLGQQLGVAGTYSPAIAPHIAYSHLPPGRYTLICMLANNNHTPTGVEAKQTIVVR
ncbi:MAG TPA: hypothetical protein VH256_04675 [Thermoleophilaceae bacterium]|jgi:hypothetical protein|nr:hypothetical protein [Thermoleophilaceae bacterium]